MRSTRLMLLPVAAATALFLGACGDSGDGASGESDKGPLAGAMAGDSSSQDDRFIQALGSVGIDTSNRGELIAEGKEVCADLESGKSMQDVFAGATSAEKAGIVGAAIGTYCPDQQSKIAETIPTT